MFVLYCIIVLFLIEFVNYVDKNRVSLLCDKFWLKKLNFSNCKFMNWHESHLLF